MILSFKKLEPLKTKSMPMLVHTTMLTPTLILCMHAIYIYICRREGGLLGEQSSNRRVSEWEDG